MIGEPYVLVICAVVGFFVVLFVLFFFLLARKRKEKMTGGEYTTVPMKDVVSTPLYCEPQDRHPMPLIIRSAAELGQYPNILDPEYAVPDVVGFGTMNAINGKMMQFREYPLSKQHQQQQELTKRKYPNLEDDARYYASTDVLARSNLLSFEQPSDPSSYAINSQKFCPLGEQFVGSKANSIATHTPPPPPLPQMHSSVSPPSSLSSNSSRILKQKPSAQNSDFEGYENTQIHSSSTKSPSPESIPPVPSLLESEIKTIDGEFGYSKFGDCELGYLLRNNEKKLVILKTLSDKCEYRQFYNEFVNEMEEKWRLSNRCIDTFAMMYGYVVKHEYLAMVIEYGDIDLKKYLRTASPTQIR